MFLERSYNLGDIEDAVRLVIEEPVYESNDWLCRWTIEMKNDVYKQVTFGVDKLQALTLALKMALAKLNSYNHEHAEQITVMGDQRIDLI